MTSPADEGGTRAVESVDLLIVGGGINGVGIARDAAGRGLKVALVERGDLGQATSSASTKLIHGGLRYLEHYEFRLVREALAERERLLGIAPHLIRPLRFVLPHVEGLRPRWLIRLGLLFYDHAGGRSLLPRSQGVNLAGGELGGVLREDIRHGFAYSDCWVDDSRLVVLNAVDAAARGAQIRVRTEMISAAAQGDRWSVRCRDLRSGCFVDFKARAIVNAAGPWVDAVIHRIGATGLTWPQVRLVKGSHIVVPRLYEGAHAFTLQHPDGRVVFAIPYEGDFTVIGTTDVPFEGDATEATASMEETRYLCNTVNRYFATPSITPADVVWSYAGVRPLFDDETADASKVTRDYTLELATPAGSGALLSVFGGKITTYRRLAEAAMARLAPYLGCTSRGWTVCAPLPGGDLPARDFGRFLTDCQRRWPWMPARSLERMCRAYGTVLESILGGARRLPDLGADHGAGLSDAELQHLIQREWALSEDDVLWRRTKLALHMTAAERAAFVLRPPAQGASPSVMNTR